MINSKSIIRKSTIVIMLILFALGAYGALKAAAFSSALESDFSDTAMLWFGWHQYGWHFLKSWGYTPDNWLFSLVPLHFLMFSLIGTSPTGIFLSGWAIFIISLILLGAIAYRLRAPVSACLLPLMLVFVNQYTFAKMFIAYSVSHNITFFYGLVSFLLMLVSFTKRQPIYWLLLSSYCMLVAALSDPWFMAAFLYPLLAASAMVTIFNRFSKETKLYRQVFLWLLLMLALKIILFHALHHFAHVFNGYKCVINIHNIPANLLLLLHITGKVFNLMPASFLHGPANIIVSLMLVFLLSSMAIYYFFAYQFYKDLLFCFVISFLGLSMLATCTSFVILEPLKLEETGRYFMNTLFFLPLLIALILEKAWSIHLNRYITYFAMLLGCAFILSGVIANAAILKTQPVTLNDSDVSQLSTFLNAHQLTYGFSTYWGGQANAVTLLTQRKINLVSATFSNKDGHLIPGGRLQTSTLWRLPTSNQHFFVLFAKDDENCSDMQRCLTGVTKQFGPPKQILSYRNDPVYVW